MSVRHKLGAQKGLLQKIIVSGATKGLGALLTFLSFVAIARASSPEEFGRFSMAFAVASILSYLLVGGQQQTILKFYPKYSLVEDGGQSASRALRVSTRFLAYFLIGGSIFVLAVVYGLLAAGVAFENRLPVDTLLWALGLGAGLALAEFLSNYYRAKERLLFGLLPRDVVWRFLIVVIFGVVLFEASGMALRADIVTATEAMVIMSLVLVLAILPQVVGLARNLRSPAEVDEATRREIESEYRATTVPFWGIALIWPIQSYIGVLLIGFLIGEADTGAFFSAKKLSALLAIISVAINQAIAPVLSRASARGDIAELRKVFLLSCVVGGILSLSSFAVFAAFGDTILGLFDPAYESFYGILLILCLGQVVFNVTGPAGLMLSLVGKERYVLAVTTSTAIVGTITVSLCTVFFGVYGTAAASAFTTLTWNAIFFVTALRYFRTSARA